MCERCVVLMSNSSLTHSLTRSLTDSLAHSPFNHSVSQLLTHSLTLTTKIAGQQTHRDLQASNATTRQGHRSHISPSLTHYSSSPTHSLISTTSLAAQMCAKLDSTEVQIKSISPPRIPSRGRDSSPHSSRTPTTPSSFSGSEVSSPTSASPRTRHLSSQYSPPSRDSGREVRLFWSL